MELHGLLKICVEQKASDLHLKVGRSPMLRVSGKLTPLEMPVINEKDMKDFIAVLLSPDKLKQFDTMNEIDLAYTSDGLPRFRVNIFRQKCSIEMVMRVIPTKIPLIEDLNLPPILNKIAMLERGLVLVTGITGSGKSTTIASMINYINNKRECHIVSIEDPIEFVHDDIKSSITQRELGIDTESFPVALKYVLRQDPDVIFIGEMRDFATVSSAITAAETGHLVFSTLHTIDASQTIDRIIDFFPPHQQTQVRTQFANTVEAVVSNRLVEKADGAGMVPAVEIMLGTPTIRALIREGKTKDIRSQINAGSAQYGMQTFDQSLIDLYKKKLITLENALSEATSPNDFKLAITGIISSSASAQDSIRK